MRVLHLSHTPLVGAPGRICDALREAAGVDSRWCVLDDSAGMYQTMSFGLDLVWRRDREQVIELAEQCDVLHLHNYIDLDNRDFAPLDFRRMFDLGKPMVRQFHSGPDAVARFMRKAPAEVLACPIPKLVIAQYHERYYPSAKLVPNFPGVASNSRGGNNSRSLRIGFAPTRFNSGRDSRWDTKGYPETVRMLKSVRRAAARRGTPCEVDLIEMVSHAECLRRKSTCDLFVDDLVTGSYHLNTLESLAMGIPCLCFLDGRTQHALLEITGRDDFPVVNAGLEHSAGVLLDLLGSRDLVCALGASASTWMATHWSASAMAEHFLDSYRFVRERPGMPFPNRFDPSDLCSQWRTAGIYDAQWKARQAGWPKLMPKPLLGAKAALGSSLRGLKKALGA